jgi:hypothetical protein
MRGGFVGARPGQARTAYREQMGTHIKRRDDVDPDEGENKYGEVQFADPTNNKYPIDTEEHVRAAWSYINKKANAAKYDAAEVDAIKGRIKHAAKRFDIEISED